eukprot:215857-Prymnesium_polylepis.1
MGRSRGAWPCAAAARRLCDQRALPQGLAAARAADPPTAAAQGGEPAPAGRRDPRGALAHLP